MFLRVLIRSLSYQGEQKCLPLVFPFRRSSIRRMGRLQVDLPRLLRQFHEQRFVEFEEQFLRRLRLVGLKLRRSYQCEGTASRPMQRLRLEYRL